MLVIFALFALAILAGLLATLAALMPVLYLIEALPSGSYTSARWFRPVMSNAPLPAVAYCILALIQRRPAGLRALAPIFGAVGCLAVLVFTHLAFGFLRSPHH